MQELALQDHQLLLGQPRLLGLVPQLVQLLILEKATPGKQGIIDGTVMGMGCFYKNSGEGVPDVKNSRGSPILGSISFLFTSLIPPSLPLTASVETPKWFK